ncbi:MAG TPA: hypothetical protein VHE56_07160 [Mycobacteriales bacterium]|nr:hypothetical protein [Mycobacteriales bacterium]
MKTKWTAITTGVAVLMAGGALVTTTAFGASSDTVRVKTKTVSPFGKILVKGNGATLYVYTEDTKGVSNCGGDCATEWPPFIVRKGYTVSNSVSGIGTIKRKSGKRQVAYHGRALYQFAGDSAPGQANGQGVEGTWHVVRIGSTAQPTSSPTESTSPTVTPTDSSSPTATPTDTTPVGGGGGGSGGGGPTGPPGGGGYGY